MITIIRNVLVISAIVLWCFIGLCYLTVFLKNKFSKGKKVNNNTHKDTFVQSQSGTINNSVADNEESVSDKDINNSINSNNSNKGKADNNNNEGKSNLCL